MADLDIQGFFGPDVAVVGEPEYFRIEFVNEGPAAALDVEAQIEFPAGWEVQSASVSGSSEWSCAVSGQAGVCTIDPLPRSDGFSQTLFVSAVPSEPAADAIISASVTSSLPDPDGPAEATMVVDVVTPLVDLGISVTDVFPTVAAGTDQHYSVFATNNGPALAQNAVLTTTAPATTSIVSASSHAGSCEVVGQTATCRADDIIAPETGFGMDLRVRVLTLDTPIELTATVSSSIPQALRARPSTEMATMAMAL